MNVQKPYFDNRSKYVGDFMFLLKEGDEEEPVVHNEAAVFRLGVKQGFNNPHSSCLSQK